MPFDKGKEKTGGRQKGTSNKIKSRLKEAISEIVDSNLETIRHDLAQLEPKDRISLLLKFVEYVLPKERETKIDFSGLTDNEIDELIERVTNEANRQN
jgi:hypothetical protein